jgi:hypothetical protein
VATRGSGAQPRDPSCRYGLLNFFSSSSSVAKKLSLMISSPRRRQLPGGKRRRQPNSRLASVVLVAPHNRVEEVGGGCRHGHRWMAGGTAKLEVVQGGRSCTKKCWRSHGGVGRRGRREKRLHDTPNAHVSCLGFDLAVTVFLCLDGLTSCTTLTYS